MPSEVAIREQFRRIRSVLTDLLKLDDVLAKHRELAPRIGEAIQAMDDVERQVDAVTVTAMAQPGRRPRGKPKTYRIEHAGKQELLAEYRPDDENPFRCPRSTYDGLARVFAKTERLVKYEEVAKSLRKELGSMPADFQIRVVLRFWSQPDVGLIERARARYRPHDSRNFADGARRAWENAGAARMPRSGAM
jgi:hypothetical protein